MSHLDSTLHPFTHRQHGVFSRDQARSLGFSDRQIADRVARQEWVRVDIGVYRHRATPPSPAGRLLAACLAGRGLASHRAAAQLHGLWHFDRPELIVPSSANYRGEATVVHRSLDLVDADRTEVDGVPCTNAVRTLLDVGAVLPLGAVELIFDRALNRGLVDIEAVTTRFLQVAKRGRRGVGHARRILEARDPSLAPLESELEIRVLRILLANGLPTPTAQHEVHVSSHRISRSGISESRGRVGGLLVVG